MTSTSLLDPTNPYAPPQQLPCSYPDQLALPSHHELCVIACMCVCGHDVRTKQYFDSCNRAAAVHWHEFAGGKGSLAVSCSICVVWPALTDCLLDEAGALAAV
jgi:hypothetical protein